MNSKKIKRNNDGYAILFTVVIVGIISMITIGLSNSAYKQTILSSVARDSTTAFYQADIGSECALYIDNNYQDKMGELKDGEFNCAHKDMDFDEPIVSDDVTSYNLTEETLPSSKCFRITINKTSGAESNSTEVVSKGYNICNKSNIRTVERGIRVTY